MNSRKVLLTVIVMMLLLTVGTMLFLKYSYKRRDQIWQQYMGARTAFEAGEYQESIEALSPLGDYKDSLEYIERAKQIIAENEARQAIREEAQQEFARGNYKTAAELYRSLGDRENELSALYAYAEDLYNSDYAEHLSDALTVYQELGDYKDSRLKAATISVALYPDHQEVIYQKAKQLFLSKDYYSALDELSKIPEYEKAVALKAECEKTLRLKYAKSVSVGIEYSVAISNTGRVYTTAEHMPWQSVINDWEDIISISCMEAAIIGLKADGTVMIATNSAIIHPDEWKDERFFAVSAGDLYVAALKSDGKVIGQGHNADGQTAFEKDENDGDSDENEWNRVVAIATGWRHTVGLRITEEGTSEILITGFQSNLQLRQIQKQPDLWQDIVAIAAGGGSQYDRGDGHTVGLRKNGTVVAVGDNRFGQCEVDSWTNIVAIAAGDWFTAGLTSNGEIVMTRPSAEVCEETGVNLRALSAQEWTDIVSIAAGSGNIVGIDKDGKVHAAGNDNKRQTTNALKWENLMVYPAR